MIRMMILLCPFSVDPADCTADTALQTLPGPVYENREICVYESRWLQYHPEVVRVAHKVAPGARVRLTCVKDQAVTS